MELNRIYTESWRDTIERLPKQAVQVVVTSPPYYKLRDYNHPDQLGQEATPELYIQKLVEGFRALRPKLRDDGTLWINIADTYTGYKAGTGDTDYVKHTGSRPEHERGWQYGDLKPKDMIGIPWMLAFALRADGWYLRQDIIWHKRNPMPESVTDRCTKSHEYLFLLSKSERYYYDWEAILEEANYDGRKDTKMKGSPKYAEGFAPSDKNPQGLSDRSRGHERWVNRTEDDKPARNKRSVWDVPNKPFKGAHFAVFPPDLVVPCIKAGCPEGGLVYDPFGGSGTTAEVAIRLGRQWVISELNPEYVKDVTTPRLAKYTTESLF